MNDEYGGWAEIYPEWTQHMEEDIPFYVEEYTAVEGPVVELGVGAGRIAIEAAKKGQRVIGIDSSPAMLASGRRNAEAAGVADRVTFIEAAMQDWVSPEPVRLVAIPFRSFLHLMTVDDQLAALDNVRRSLVSGGRLILNVVAPDTAAMTSWNGRRMFRAEFTDDQGRRAELWMANTYDPHDQTLRMRGIVEAFDDDGRLIDTTERQMRVRLSTRYEFEHLFARSGLAIDALYGWFDRRPYGPGSDEMIWVVRRP